MSVEARACAQRTRNEELCNDTLWRCVDLALEVCSFRRFAQPPLPPSNAADPVPNGSLLPALIWHDMKRVFVCGRPLAAMDKEVPPGGLWGEGSSLALRKPGSAKPGSAKPGNAKPDDVPAEGASEGASAAQSSAGRSAAASAAASDAAEAAAVASLLDAADHNDLLLNKRYWRDGDLAAAEAAAKKAPAVGALPVLGCVPFFALGEVVIAARIGASPLPSKPPPPAVPRFDLTVCFAGKPFAGKSEQAYLLADRYRLKTVSAAACVAEAIAAADGAQDGAFAEELSALGGRARASVMEGRSVEDCVYAELVVLAIRRLAEENEDLLGAGAKAFTGWVLEDFPETTRQAALLERLLTGYDDGQPDPTRWDRASEAAPALPRPPPDPGALLGKSGVDLFVYLEADRETVLRRALGRRLDPSTSKTYHLDTNRPPYDLVCKERLVAPVDPSSPAEQLALQVASHDLNKDRLCAFVRRFGSLRTLDVNGLTTPGAFAAVVNMVGELVEARAESQEKWAAEEGVAEEAAEEAAEAEQSQKEDEASGEAGDEASELLGPVGQLPQEMAALVRCLWDGLEATTAANARRVFRALREERLAVLSHVHCARVAYGDFLRRPDDRQTTACAFLTAFNHGVPDGMRADARVAAELRLRCDELRRLFWASAEEREGLNVARLVAMRTDGWLEARVLAMERNFSLLVQAEADRFFAGLQALFDAAHALAGPPPEGPLRDLGATAHTEDKKKGKEDDAPKPPSRPAAPPDVIAAAFAPKEKKGAAAAPPPAKGKDKSGKGDGKEGDVDEHAGDVLAAVASAALATITPWLPDSFTVGADEPHPEELHAAVWVQAELSALRVRRLVALGRAARAELLESVRHAYDEMGDWCDARLEAELEAGEALVQAALAAAAGGRPLADDWVLDGATLAVGGSFRLVPPPAPLPEPKVAVAFDRALNSQQASMLAKALATASAALGFQGGVQGADGDALLSRGALCEVLCRLAASESDLPPVWSGAPLAEGFASLAAALDPNDTGYVTTAAVVEAFSQTQGHGE